MKIPCWIKHDYDKFGEPFEEVINYFDHRHNLYEYSVSSTYQKRVCKKCGIIQKRTIETHRFNKDYE